MAYEDVEDLNGFLESLKDLAPTVRRAGFPRPFEKS